MDLYQLSIDVILQSQTSTGAFVASPTFSQYHYSWLRDGSFVAYALDLAGMHKQARDFHQWAGMVIQHHAWKVDNAVRQVSAQRPLGQDDYLHTRYTPEGTEIQESWWDFQLDGYGTWLWSLSEHIRLTRDEAFLDELSGSIATTVRYLTHVWHLPNYDCWEEHSQYLHTYTLTAVYAGLREAGDFVPDIGKQASAAAAEIKRVLLQHGTVNGRFVKSFSLDNRPQSALRDAQQVFHDSASDKLVLDAAEASLIALSTPYRLLSDDDPLLQATIERIENELHRPGGGVYRFRDDTYYGGGEWVLLAGWLGWHYARAGKSEEARELKTWIEVQANETGYLPEQVSDHLLAPDRLAEWQNRWGPVARPLTWSHAMYLILCLNL